MSAIPLAISEDRCRSSAPPYPAWYPEQFHCRSRPSWPPSAEPHDRRSPARTWHTVFLRYHRETCPRQSTIANCFLSPPRYRYMPVSMAVAQVYVQATAHSDAWSDKYVWRWSQTFHQVLSAKQRPYPTITRSSRYMPKGCPPWDSSCVQRAVWRRCLTGTDIKGHTDAVMEQVVEWQNRPLDAVYPIVYLDCIVLKVRQDSRVINKSVFLALGINIEGQKELLGM